MITINEVVHLGHGGTVDLILKADSVAVSLASVTQITMTFGTLLVDGSSKALGPITWAQGGYAVGEMRAMLGSQAIPVGDYNVPIIVYDSTYSTGVVWGYVPVVVKANPEAASP